jgi:hypothetical protein
MVLGELYHRFSGLFKPEIERALKAPVIAFVETARKFLRTGEGGETADRVEADEGGGKADPKQGADAGVRESPAEPEPRVLPPGQVWDIFTVYLERLTGKQGPLPRLDCAGPENVTGEGHSQNPSAAFAYAYAVLSLLRPIIGEDADGADAVSLVLHWQLDRKLREILGGLGIERETLWRGLEIMKALLSRVPGTKASAAAKAAGAVSAQAAAQTLLLDNYDKDDFRRILGVNVFDDVTWFNKESFEEALSFGSLFAAVETGDFALIKKIDAELRRAEAKSGYDLTRFIEALAPPAKKEGTPGEKAAIPLDIRSLPRDVSS